MAGQDDADDRASATAAGATTPSGSTTGFLGIAPASAFTLRTPGVDPKRTSAFGWASSSSLTAGKASLTLDVAPLAGLLSAATLLAWLAVALCLLGRHRWLDWWWPTRRSSAGTATSAEVDEPVEAEVGGPVDLEGEEVR